MKAISDASRNDEWGLAGKLLIAMPTLQDPTFERSVLFICTHSAEGALGLIINHPHLASWEEVISPLGLKWHKPEHPTVFQGGPVALDRGFILYETRLTCPGHVCILDDLYLGTNPEILRHLVKTTEQERFLFALGYAGWAGGQLETELKENVWLVSSLDRQLLFDAPVSSRWHAALQRMGIDPAQLVTPPSDQIN